MNTRDGERLLRGSAWALYLAVAWAGGGVAMWIAPWQRWAVALGGVVLVLALLASLPDRSKKAPPESDAEPWAAFDALRNSLVHLLPAFLLAMLGVTSLTSQALQRADLNSNDDRRPSVERKAGAGDLSLGLLASRLEAGSVQTIGMVFRPDAAQVATLKGSPDPKDVPLLLYRFEITCCAADALPRSVVLTGVDPAAYAADTWLRVRGSLTPSGLVPHSTGGLAVLEATSVEVIPEPKYPFLQRIPW
jgi:uncharacterized repeat protein (TIGR03943 family)